MSENTENVSIPVVNQEPIVENNENNENNENDSVVEPISAIYYIVYS